MPPVQQGRIQPLGMVFAADNMNQYINIQMTSRQIDTLGNLTGEVGMKDILKLGNNQNVNMFAKDAGHANRLDFPDL